MTLPGGDYRVRPIELSTDLELSRQAMTLQHAAYAVEAALIGDDRIPALHEDLDDLRMSPLTWLGAFAGDELVGTVAFEQTESLMDIDRLTVATSHARRGIGRTLLAAVLELAGRRDAVVSTGRDNRPARALYERLGFAHADDREVLPGLWISHYRRSV